MFFSISNTLLMLDELCMNGGIILPEADYVIDPKAIEGSMFSEYCGAGLAYRFAKALLTEEHPIMNNLLVFASIATVTDMVPLIGDNRTIVKEESYCED